MNLSNVTFKTQRVTTEWCDHLSSKAWLTNELLRHSWSILLRDGRFITNDLAKSTKSCKYFLSNWSEILSSKRTPSKILQWTVLQSSTQSSEEIPFILMDNKRDWYCAIISFDERILSEFGVVDCLKAMKLKLCRLSAQSSSYRVRISICCNE